jgi:2-haloacid dehalogenase
MTLIGEYRPFPELAKPVLESVLAQQGLDLDRAGEVLEALAELDAYPDAAPALERLASAGVRLAALTNGTEQNTRTLLERAGLDAYVERIIPTDAVGAYKPHAAVYRHAVGETAAFGIGTSLLRVQRLASFDPAAVEPVQDRHRTVPGEAVQDRASRRARSPTAPSAAPSA